MKINSIFRNSLIVTISRISTAGINFLFFSILAHILNTNDFGLFSTWITALNFASTFYLLGMNVSYIYFSKNKLQQIINFILSIKTLTFFFILFLFILVILLQIFNKIFFKNFLILSLLVSIYTISIASMINSYFQKIENFKLYSIFIFLPYFLNFLIIFFDFYILKLEINLKIIVIIYIFSIIFSILLGFYFFINKNKKIIKNYIFILFNKKILNSNFIKYGIKATSLLLISQILYASDIFLIKFIKGTSEVSFYFVAVAISKITWLLTDSVGNVIFPKLTKLDKSQYKSNEVNESLSKILWYLFGLNIFFIITFYVIGEKFIHLFFSEKYAGSYTLVIILIIASYGMSIYKIYSRKFAAINEWKEVYESLILSSILNIILNIILINYYSTLGAAIASLISYWICGLYLLYKDKIFFKGL